LTTSPGATNALSAGRISLPAGIHVDLLEVLQWTAGAEEMVDSIAGAEEMVDSIAELGIGIALSVRHIISLRG